MDTKKLIELIELKDKYAIALMEHHLNKGVVANQKFQEYIDNICNDWAKTFITTYSNQFIDEQTRIAVFRYLDGFGAKHGHSGKRFSEALYRLLHYIYTDNKNKIELSK